jgi:WhiB family transcriptional regulator, redox-sensing transcriptional regulator
VLDVLTTSARVGVSAIGMDLPEAPEWMAMALCAETDPEAFFPEKGRDSSELTALAKRVCALCDVREDCLEYAIEQRIEHGTWGGLTAHQRKMRRKGQPVRTPALRTACSSGHELVPGNVRIRRSDGARICLKCEARRARDRRARIAAARAA